MEGCHEDGDPPAPDSLCNDEPMKKIIIVTKAIRMRIYIVTEE